MKASLLPSGKYRVQVVVGHDENGKRIVKSFTAEKEWEALKMADEYLNNGHKSDLAAYMTVGDAFLVYIESRNNILSPSTIQGYNVIRNSRLQTIKDIYIRELTIADIQSAINYDSLRLSRKSIKSALALLKSALALQEVEINLKRLTLPQARKNKSDIPSAEELITIIVGTDIELPCLLAMWLSLRMSEVRGLQFRDISNDGKFITVRRAMLYLNKDLLREQTKTSDSTRTNALPPYLYELINKVPHKKKTDFIVSMPYQSIRRRFNKLMLANGFSLTFHKLRHEFATTLNDLGVPSDYIQKIGGWSTDNVMKSVYTHTTSSKEAVYQRTIDMFFENAIRKSHESHENQ